MSRVLQSRLVLDFYTVSILVNFPFKLYYLTSFFRLVLLSTTTDINFFFIVRNVLRFDILVILILTIRERKGVWRGRSVFKVDRVTSPGTNGGRDDLKSVLPLSVKSGVLNHSSLSHNTTRPVR